MPGNRIVRNMLFLILVGSFCSGCAVVRTTMEMGLAYVEKPSMELVLDRLNTAASAADLASVALNHVPISSESSWPRQLESFPEEQMQPISKALALDGAYSAHGGFFSPIKAHIIQTQKILYLVPPDMYAASGSCYRAGEETIIHGVYYRINSSDDILIKPNASPREVQSAVNAAAASIFVSQPCQGANTLIKRAGKLRPQTGDQVYPNLMQAMIQIVPNGREIARAYHEYDRVREDLLQMEIKISGLETDKKRLENREEVLGRFRSLPQINEKIQIKKTLAKDLEIELYEKNQILKLTLDAIGDFQGAVTHPAEIQTLQNVLDATRAINGLLLDALSLTSVALAKLHPSLAGLQDELKRISNTTGVQQVYVPIRLARIRFNLGNIFDNITSIISVIQNDLVVVQTLRRELGELLKIETL